MESEFKVELEELLFKSEFYYLWIVPKAYQWATFS
jgi:hypothetical protein